MIKNIAFLSIVFALIYPKVSLSQLLKDGQYVGYEKIHVRIVTGGQLDYYPGMYIKEIENSVNKTWFHKVTITIKKDVVNVTKVPVFIINHQVHFSDSTGIFFNYISKVVKASDSTIRIVGNLISSKYARKNLHGPFYSMVVYHNIQQNDNSLFFKAGYLGNLRFQKRLKKLSMHLKSRLTNVKVSIPNNLFFNNGLYKIVIDISFHIDR